jgi:hypothetical protein
VRTPWLQIDDIFYEARGSSWALLHFLKAVEVDFDAILKKKNALRIVLLQNIIIMINNNITSTTSTPTTTLF